MSLQAKSIFGMVIFMGGVMTREKREFAEMLGLLDFSRNPEIEQEKRLALRYLNSGANIPRTLLTKIERVSLSNNHLMTA